MAVAGREHLVTELAERVADEAAHVLVILDQEDGLSRLLGRRPRLDLDRGIGERRGIEPRQVDLHGRALAGLAVELDVSARLLDEAEDL